MHEKDLSTTTIGERLWILRRRRFLTQKEEAAMRGLGQNRYTDMELDRVEGPPPGCRLRLDLPEKMRLARRRVGPRLGLRALGRLLGVSHMTFLKWEREGSGKLRTFWEKKGFTFD